MKVELLTSETSLADMEKFAAIAALTCHGNAEKEHVPSEVLGRIIKAGHESILEHITLTYSVKGISRALLQELARHRHISLSVESTRYTLRKKLEDDKFIAKLLNDDEMMFEFPRRLEGAYYREMLRTPAYVMKCCPDITDDELKYYLPEFWPTNLILTVNIRELRHILDLRTAPEALREFRDLCHAMYEAVPEEFRYLIEDCMH